MSGHTGLNNSPTRLEALDFQSSSYGVVIPVVGGVARIAGNLIYYNDFASHAQKQSGGKGGGVTTGYDYTASVIMGLCHGQVAGVPRVWVGNQLYSDSTGSGAVTESAVEHYTVPSIGGYYNTVNQAAFAANTKVTGTVTQQDGSSAQTTYAEGTDYVQQNGTYYFPANSRACGAAVTIAYTYTQTSASDPALTQLVMTLSTGTIPQTAPSWVTQLHPSDAMGYSGLALVAAQNYDLGSSGSVSNHNFEVVGPGAYSISSSIPDMDPSVFAVAMLKSSRYGCYIPSQYIGDTTLWSNYCLAANLLMSPAVTTQTGASDFMAQMSKLTNTALVWSCGVLKFIPYGDAPLTGNGVTYTPNTTPVYDLTDDVFITDGSEPPVKVTRKKTSDTFNRTQLQFNNRGNAYAPEVAEAKDQADIDLNGLRPANQDQADWICDPNVARNVAQLILQRSLYVRCTYEFSLPWNFCFLEPMDLVTIADPTQGLVKTVVRITKTEEDGESLKFTAEDWTLGVANTASYNTQVGVGYSQNYNVSPGSISAATIFEGPGAESSTTGLQVWVAAYGSNAWWGGCDVWVSLDNVNYRQVGTINGACRFGHVNGPVTGSTLSVTLNTGQLTSGSAQDAAQLSTLSFVGGANPEYLAYESAALTAAETYSLSGLNRGVYGTSATAVHAAGDPFIRCDSSVLSGIDLPATCIGQQLYLKFTSFNLYGEGEESIANVAAHTYTPTGEFMGSSTAIAAQNAAITAQASASRALTLADAIGGTTLVNKANMTIVGNTATKTGGAANTWDSAIQSKDGFVGGSYVSFAPAQNNAAFMMGLNSDPGTGVSYTTLDYAIYCESNGSLQIYESSALAVTLGTYAAGDVLAVTYDGTQIKYFQNGNLLRTVTTKITAPLYLDSCFDTSSGSAKNIQFGPMSSTTGLQNNDAATMLGFNPTFTWGNGTYPDGWQGWAGSVPTKVVTTQYPVAVQWTLQASDVSSNNCGMLLTHAFAVPMAAGSFLQGSFMVNMLNYVGGGGPGYLIRLYTNLAGTTYVDNPFVLQNPTTGGWQKVPFTATANGASVYSIQIFQMATWLGDSTFTDGAVGNSMQFGPFTFDVYTQLDSSHVVPATGWLNSNVTLSPTGQLLGGGGGQITFVRGTNYMDCSGWAVNSNALALTGWGSNQSGTGAADAIVAGTMPDGSSGLVWQATQGAGAVNGGGWNPAGSGTSNWFPVNTAKKYLFAVYVKQTTAGGAVAAWWGPTNYGTNVVDSLNTTTANINPYFTGSVTLPVLNRWYLLVGYVFPQGSTGMTNAGSGCYDLVTGQLVVGGSNFNWDATCTYTGTRCFQYYGNAGDVMQFAWPQVYMCDGSEPGLQDLLSPSVAPGATVGALWGTNLTGTPPNLSALAGNEYLVNADAASTMGFNPSFSNWTGVLPAGWSYWTAAEPPIKTTAYAPPGAPWGVQWIVSATDVTNTGLGMSCIWAPGSAPLPAGTVLTGSYSVLMINGCPQTPGLLIRLFTNSAGTTYVDNLAPVLNPGLGGWQKVPFTATANGLPIYSVQIYQMAGYSGFPGGMTPAGTSMVFGPFSFNVDLPISAAQTGSSIVSTANPVTTANAAQILGAGILATGMVSANAITVPIVFTGTGVTYSTSS